MPKYLAEIQNSSEQSLVILYADDEEAARQELIQGSKYPFYIEHIREIAGVAEVKQLAKLKADRILFEEKVKLFESLGELIRCAGNC
jgi:hypothetical protein